MKSKKLKLCVLLLGLGLMAQAQQASVVTGGDASGSGGTVAYSVGQVVYSTQVKATGSVAQGVQQPYEISIVSSIDFDQVNQRLQVYPNPTTDYLILNVGESDRSNLKFQLFDISGRLIADKKIANIEELIRLDNLPGAVYFLKVFESNKDLKTFKIIKN